MAPAAALAGVAAAVGYVGAVDPHQPGHYPVCPLFRWTGVLCPGCGGLRSVHSLAHGDLTAALGANAPVVAGCAAFLCVWALWVGRAARGRPMSLPLRPVHAWLLAALLAVFTVVRNLPFGSVLAP
nr:DUF2752 domain-containing protein [Streptomyces sp. TP-A0874]